MFSNIKVIIYINEVAVETKKIANETIYHSHVHDFLHTELFPSSALFSSNKFYDSKSKTQTVYIYIYI